jgi:biofilm PGA synthesis N-glycosyltransferase PgaC
VLATYAFDLLSSNIAGQALAASSDHVAPLTSLLPEFSGVIIGTTCLLQMLLSMLLERRYDHKLLRYFMWTIWYPFGFWMVNMFTIVVALPKMLLRQRGMRARWVSPDRGID